MDYHHGVQEKQKDEKEKDQEIEEKEKVVRGKPADQIAVMINLIILRINTICITI